jgi:hypothetical protein
VVLYRDLGSTWQELPRKKGYLRDNHVKDKEKTKFKSSQYWFSKNGGTFCRHTTTLDLTGGIANIVFPIYPPL